MIESNETKEEYKERILRAIENMENNLSTKKFSKEEFENLSEKKLKA